MDNLPKIGRGRGRGRTEADDPPSSSSRSSQSKELKRKDAAPGGNDNKRGAIRDNRIIPSFYKTRPESSVNTKMGTSGTPLSLKANYFPIKKMKNFEMIQYRVDFSPNIELDRSRKFLLFTQKNHLGGFLYDGGNSLFLSKRLPNEITDFTSKLRDETVVKITIKNTGNIITMTDGMSLQILNIIMRRSMDGLKLQLVGRNLFDAANKVSIPNYRIDLWPGYLTSIRQHEENLLMCAEISHKVMRCETALDLLIGITNNSNRGYQDKFVEDIVGTTILTAYNNKCYKISDVDFKISPMDTFETKNGPITYVEYYKKNYNINIRDMRQPMLISTPKARDIRGGRSTYIALIPELCRITGMTDSMRNDFNLMKELARHTKMDPRNRIQRLMDFNKRLHEVPESDGVFKEWNLELDRHLVEFKGRQLPQTEIIFNDNKKVMNDERADWTNEFKNKGMFLSIPLKNWAIIFPKRSSRETNGFLDSLKQTSRTLQYSMSAPNLYEIPDDRSETFLSAIESILKNDPSLIMIVVPNNRSDRYTAIKRKCCVLHAVPTQVVLQKTISKPPHVLGGISRKVVIQINCKLGGIPWTVHVPLAGIMVVGFDVSHDTTDKSKSFGAMVAALDPKANKKYFCAVEAHRNGEELSGTISVNLVKALRAYVDDVGSLPVKIFFYRDGVGDGQIEYVHKNEIQSMMEKLKGFYGEERTPSLTVVIVNKRINTRIFTHDYKNPYPGTIVDNTITLPERYDFYLVSQSVRDGTVAPTSYNVIYDTVGMPPDRLQLLTYKFCHDYYNWSGTTRVPSVVQYAHKLSMLVGQYIHQAPSNDLTRRLFFL